MERIVFRYKQNLPTIAPGIEGVALFEVAANIDEQGNEVEIFAATCAIENAENFEHGVYTFYTVPVPRADSQRTEDQKFLGLLREKAREYFAKKQRMLLRFSGGKD